MNREIERGNDTGGGGVSLRPASRKCCRYAVGEDSEVVCAAASSDFSLVQVLVTSQAQVRI
ncbi:hypothetical protein Hdeb2414_s0006g00213361 [Helianthus debilis subsp. tardiflorus]